jgi:hypothetical protein
MHLLAHSNHLKFGELLNVKTLVICYRVMLITKIINQHFLHFDRLLNFWNILHFAVDSH